MMYGERLKDELRINTVDDVWRLNRGRKKTEYRINGGWVKDE
jgi:hypothetical protein